MTMDKEVFLNSITKGINKSLDILEESILVEEVDILEEGVLIVDEVQEDFPEYELEVSLKGIEDIKEEDFEEIEEVEFQGEDFEGDLEINPFSEELELEEKENSFRNRIIPNEYSPFNLDEIEEVDEEFEDLEEDFEELEKSYGEEDEGFKELSWDDEGFGEIEEDIFLDEEVEEEILEEELIEEVLEEELLEEELLEEELIEEELIEEEILEEESIAEVKEVSNEVKKEEVVVDAKFLECDFERGMSIEDYLRANPKYRHTEYIEHFYSKEEIEEALIKGTILIKKGIFRI